ncbi:uncharacterized protein [Maniola hyperantus]|uniref:uncharacterized protein n=1 Tax=Aphantopus hyperantus TaxID=2795564 RepID=UPI002126F9DA
MVTFMEQHGDLSKPSSNARGRISNLRPPSQRRAVSSPPLGFIEDEVHDPGMRPLTRHSTQVHEVWPAPALSGQTTLRRARPTQARRSQRKKLRQAAQHFLRAEEFWRKFKIEQHRDYMDLRREENRIREMEVRAQMQWQAVVLRALDILDKLANKYCKD